MDIDGLRNMMFVFKTKSKRNIIQLFNFRSSKANNIDETQIKEVNDYLYIPIDLKNWLDIDTNKTSHLLECCNKFNRNIQIVNADMLQLPFKDNTFDSIICLSSLHHLSP